MASSSQPVSYFTLASQYLRLAYASCGEIVAAGNRHWTTHDPHDPAQQVQREHERATRWADHSLGTAVLFSHFHGIELILKGFLVAPGKPRGGHWLTPLLADFARLYPSEQLSATIAAALPQAGQGSPLERFLAENGITIDQWFEALKYPEDKNAQQAYDHWALKFGGSDTVDFWRERQDLSARIANEAQVLAKKRGLIF